MSKRETSAEINSAALDWVARIDAGPMDSELQAALDDWLAGDSRRMGAIARAQAMMASAERTRALGAHFDPDAFLARQDPEPGSALPGVIVDKRTFSRRSVVVGGSFTAFTAIAATTLLGWEASAQTYSTKRGEIRTVPLSDGSSMTLNTSSAARVWFGKSQRKVDLLEGEALFNVTRDPHRPFFVSAGDTLVKAAGTSFSIHRKAQGPVELLVRQGSVEVSNAAVPDQPAVLLAANNSAVETGRAAIHVAPISPSQVDRQLAWRDGMLSFEDETLRAAAGEFARYSDRTIEFADAGIADERVTGLYAASNPEGFARSAALSLGLRADIQARRITLTR